MGSWDCSIILFSLNHLLDKMGVEYDPEDKYLTRDGKKLPAPAELINA